MSPLTAGSAAPSSSPRAGWGGDTSPPRVGTGRRIALFTAAAMVAALVVPLTGTGLAAPAQSVSLVPPLTIETLNVCSPLVVQTDAPDAVVDVEVVAEADAGIQFCEPTGHDVINPVNIDPATGDLGAGPIESDGNIGGEATTAEGGPDGSGVFTFGLEAWTAATFDVTAFGEDGDGNDDPDPDEPTSSAQLIVVAFGGGEQEPVPGATELVTNLDCVPETDTRASGAKHTFFCLASGQDAVGIFGAEVSFDVTGGPNREEVDSTPCTVTDSNGIAACEYTDSLAVGSPAGTDIILGFADLDSAAPGPEEGAPNDEIRNTFGGGKGAKKVKSRVTIRKKFRGAVRSSVGRCKKARKVVIKKARKGRDKIVARDKTNRKGKYSVRKGKVRGRFYALAKPKRITAKGGKVVCRRGKSATVKRR